MEAVRVADTGELDAETDVEGWPASLACQVGVDHPRGRRVRRCEAATIRLVSDDDGLPASSLEQQRGRDVAKCYQRGERSDRGDGELDLVAGGERDDHVRMIDAGPDGL
jgi:hypothetical protein